MFEKKNYSSSACSSLIKKQRIRIPAARITETTNAMSKPSARIDALICAGGISVIPEFLMSVTIPTIKIRL